ncbi:PAS domain S-box protein [Hydrogenophaga sp. MI9]|uniref:PAS domain S-box protein n=1 Tax=Hydrogenophaga sp. MI9 TaxID=3453719 RepID=UPI003EEFDF70
MGPGIFRHQRQLTIALMVIGGLLTVAGLPLVHGRWWHSDYSLGAGVALLLTGAWHWSSLARARVLFGELTGKLTMMARVAQHTGSPVLVIDGGLKAVWCNEAFERCTGFSLAEIRGHRVGPRLRSPNADPVAIERIRDALRSRTDIDIELLHRYRDGRDRWVRVILSSQRDDAGQFSGFVSVMVDIDAQWRIREDHRKSLRDLSALMSTLERYVIVAETDAEGRLTRVNRRFLDISGYAEAELLGQRFSHISSGWHNKAFWEEMWSRIGRGLPWQGEICNRSKEGRLYWVQTLIAPFVGPRGVIEKFVAFQTDISEHRLARIELSKSQTLLTRTNQLAGVGGWYAMLPGGILTMTPECRQVLGVREGEAGSVQELWRLFQPGARLVVRRQLDDLVQRRCQEVSFLAPLRSLPDGAPGESTRWVKLVASFGETDGGGAARQHARIVGAVQDYTPQVRAQERIRGEQRLLHSAMDSIGEAFALYDPDRRLVYFNDEYAAWMPSGDSLRLGMRHEDVLQLSLKHHPFKDATGREAEWMQEVLRAPRSNESDRIRQTADGRWIRFVDRITADGYQVVFRYDVTELQNALIQADAAAVSKGQFLANMSHEIRTPINAIMGMLQLLGYTALDGKQTDMVDKSLGATRSLLEIINEILDFSKIEAGMMRLHLSSFRLSDLHREIEVILSGALGSKPVALVYDIDPALPEVVVGDPVRLRQVLINLGGNAIKFTPDGSVTMRWRLLQREAGHARIRFAVEDTGIGIAADQQASVFESFSQGESSTNRRFGGSGLGLTISQHLVNCMGGRIALTSAPGQGSAFFFEIDLPEGVAADLPPGDGLAPRPQGGRLQGIRLLLAEDNALNQEVATEMLQREGASIALAENGLQAVDALRAAPEGFDAVLMDMQMPELDGLRATERIRDGLGLRELPIIAMTANAMPADRDRCLQAGMNAHIGKPFDIHEVIRVVRRFTGRHDVTDEPAPATRPAELHGAADQPLLRGDEAALRRLGGNRVLLAQLRARFTHSSEELLRQAQACAARSDWTGAADAVHQLKGSASVVGAERLAQEAASAERMLRPDSADTAPRGHSARIQSLVPLLGDFLRSLADEAGPAPVSPGPAWAPDGDPDADAACLDALRPIKLLLDDADMSAIDAFDGWLEKHPAAHGARYQPLRAAMDLMDLQAAGEACARLLPVIEGVDLEIE